MIRERSTQTRAGRGRLSPAPAWAPGRHRGGASLWLPSWIGGLVGGLLLFGGLGGCLAPPKNPYTIKLENRVAQLAVEKEALGRQLEDCGARKDQLAAEVDALSGLGPARLSKLFTVQRLRIDSLTGGADYDGRPGDDGVTVYLAPLDQDGDSIKAAGAIEVFLYDLTQPDQPRPVGHCVVDDPAEVSRAWYGGWMTNHYTIPCAWSPGVHLPASREVAVRVSFLDWLTGRTLVAAVTVHIDRVGPG